MTLLFGCVSKSFSFMPSILKGKFQENRRLSLFFQCRVSALLLSFSSKKSLEVKKLNKAKIIALSRSGSACQSRLAAVDFQHAQEVADFELAACESYAVVRVSDVSVKPACDASELYAVLAEVGKNC